MNNNHEDLDAELEARVRRLEFEIEKANRVLNRLTRLVCWDRAKFLICTLLTLILMGLAVAPYVFAGEVKVPAVISYIAAFMVLISGYLTYRSHQSLEATTKLRVDTEEAVVEAKWARDNAVGALANAPATGGE